MSEMDEKKEDNINSLCKKYFTPELCGEPVSDLKRTLEFKLWTQMEKYGYKVGANYSALTQDDLDDVILFTIGECFKNWREKSPEITYVAYYAAAIKNNFAKINEKNQKKKRDEVSLEKEVKRKKSMVAFGDLLEDVHGKKKNEIDAALVCVVERLDKIEEFFREEKNSLKKDENTIQCLSALLTLELKEDFYKWGSVIREEYRRNYSFLNKQVFGMRERLSKSQVAALFGIKPTRGSHILQNFLNKIKSSV